MESVNIIFSRLALIWVLAIACLLGCVADPKPLTTDSERVFTAAAATAAERLAATHRASTAISTPIPTTPTHTSTPDNLPSHAPGQTATQTASSGVDQAAFIADVTVPDGSVYSPGEQFIKTWRLKNVGTSHWTSDYQLVYVGGEPMQAIQSSPLPVPVPPGETVDLSVSLVAPSFSGTIWGYWMLQNANGELFGIGVDYDQAFYVEINVNGGGSDSGAALTPSGEKIVKSASIFVDMASFSGKCPQTLTFTAEITMRSAGRVSLQIEAGADDPGYIYELPPPESRDFSAGTNRVLYFLELRDSVNGWAQVRTLAPNQVSSNQVKFKLICE